MFKIALQQNCSYCLDYGAMCCYSTGAQALSRAPFGQGTGPILLDDLICNGGETRLTDCFHNGVGVHNCAHYKDAGLRCRAPMPPGIMMASIIES